jgi:hypothetical protein
MQIKVNLKNMKLKLIYVVFNNAIRTSNRAHGRGEKSVQGFGGKALRKETTQKMEA